VLKFRTSGFRAAANANDVILRMVAKGAALSIADMAKTRRSTTRNTEPWLRALTLRYGSPSRFVWATAERYLPSIQREVARTMDEISREAQAAIRRNA
jgi:1-acyl-sn-glycerol-3-phosphate acyltransferase